MCESLSIHRTIDCMHQAGPRQEAVCYVTLNVKKVCRVSKTGL